MSKPLSLTVIARHSLVPLNSLLGAWLIGLIVSSVIFGVTCLQASGYRPVYLYYTKYCSRDNVSLKLFVGFLLFLDTVHLALLSMSYYQASVTNFGDFVALATVPWSLVVQVLVGGRFHRFLVTLRLFLIFSKPHFGQADIPGSFYAFRIWVLSNKSLWIPCLIGACATTELGKLANYACTFHHLMTLRHLIALASVYVNNTFRIESFSDVKTDIPYSTSALAFEVACDVLIAGSMTYNLVRNKTSFQKTSRAINTLIAYTINTGALTT
ncbi:hypothetical protein C8R44DRAFT_885166 [Mycena epipterygia]|nr:hypothetical protein C8R44DRAFT_885166 [Mycena epipterygia]